MLVVFPSCADYFKAVWAFACTAGLREQLDQALLRLHLYAASWDDPGQTKAVLYRDFAPYSFSVDVSKREENGEYRHWFTGGLVYEGPDSPADGGGPSFTVSLDGTRRGWYLHT